MLNIVWGGGEWHNFYKDGLKQMKMENWEQAAALFKKAIELDSTFALVYLHYARTINQLGYVKASRVAYEKSKKYSYKATQKERLYIEATYARVIEKDPQKSTGSG